MPAANPVTTSVEPPRAAARAGGERPTEAGFSDRLAQALATPAPGSDMAPVPGPQLAAVQGEPAPAGAAPAIEMPPAAPAPASAPSIPVPQPLVDMDGPAAVAAAEPGESEAAGTASEPDEPVSEPAQADAPTSDAAPAPALTPVPQPALVPEAAPVAAEALTDAARPGAVSPAPAQADATPDAGSRKAAGNTAQQAATEFAPEELSGNESAARPLTAQRKSAASPPSVAALRTGRHAPEDDAQDEPIEALRPAASNADASDAAPEPRADKARPAGARDPSLLDSGLDIAGTVQPASPQAAPPSAPGASDAALLTAVQPHAPAHAARPDAVPADAAPTPPPPPAAQVAPAVAALVSTTPNGMQRLVVRLDPVELGQVEVRVERADGGPAAVALTVERPETLLLLVRDQAGLHRALDQAGVPAEGRTVQFQLGQQDAGRPGQQQDLGAGGGWGGEGARHGRGESNRGWRHFGNGEAGPSSRAAWGRAGVDITA